MKLKYILGIFIVSLLAGMLYLNNINKTEQVSKNNEDTKGNQDIEITATQNNKENNKEQLDGFLFVGDSFTYRLTDIINSNTKNSNVLAVNGSTSYFWIDNFDKMPDESEVNGVVLLIGINGFELIDNLDNTKQLIDELSKKYSDEEIFVQKVFPIGREFRWFETEEAIKSRNNEIVDFNYEIKLYCDMKENVKFIDTTEGFVDDEGFLIRCADDGLHIDYKYNQEYFDNIEKSIFDNIEHSIDVAK